MEYTFIVTMPTGKRYKVVCSTKAQAQRLSREYFRNGYTVSTVNEEEA